MAFIYIYVLNIITLGSNMRKPVVDITTINAIQSIFQGKVRDPWARTMAGKFADLFIYGDIIRFPLPVPDEIPGSIDPNSEPSLLGELARRDSTIFDPIKYSSAELLTLKEEYISDTFDRFLSWANCNIRTLGTWIKLHNEPWIRPIQGPRAQHGHIFNLDPLANRTEQHELAAKLGCNPNDLFYAFDVGLRFSMYGRMTGENQHYLNHPIRDVFQPPTMQEQLGKLVEVPVSFREDISRMVGHFTQEEYSVFLHELRGHTRRLNLHKISPGECDKEVLREIASKVSIPPRLKGTVKVTGIIGSLVGGLGAIPVLGPGSAIGGALISVSSLIWNGRLPRYVANWKWFRWAVEWDIEKQAEKRE
jgi:hypothetical protein